MSSLTVFPTPNMLRSFTSVLFIWSFVGLRYKENDFSWTYDWEYALGKDKVVKQSFQDNNWTEP